LTIIQNAEDENATQIDFKLFKDKIEIYHDGEDFTEQDIDGITGIGKTTKLNELNKVGKFGIGFKSVFAITDAPEIYFDKYGFTIQDVVIPKKIENQNDIIKGTKIFLPFCSESTNYHQTEIFQRIPLSQEKIFTVLKDELQSLSNFTLLFLNHIKTITWSIENEPQIIIEKSSKLIQKDAKKVTIQSQNKEDRWLIFSRFIKLKDQDQKVEIAYKLEIDENGREKIIPVENAKLSVFFLTDKETHLKFIIQGPYSATPQRDNIPLDNEENKKIIDETAILVADSIVSIKKMNLLTIDFLNILPINSSDFIYISKAFKPIFDRVKEKLSGEEPLLPTDDNGFSIPQCALLARGDKLRELLTPDQLCTLFKHENAVWLDGKITENRTRELREYLIQELGIKEIGADQFALAIEGDFLLNQSDPWITRFYEFLNDQEALWRKKSYNQEEGILRKKPIIRLTDHKHINPFTTNGEPHAYLPSKFEALFLTVKKTTANTEKAKDFLKKLGLHEPDQIDGINKILPEYVDTKSDLISEKENLLHVEWIAKTIKQINDGTLKIEYPRKNDLEQKIRATSFLWSKNLATSQYEFKQPAEIHLGKIYTQNSDVEAFFEGNPDIWYLDEKYSKIQNLDSKAFELLGCKKQITVDFCRRFDSYGNAILEDLPRYSHKRGLNGFDPDCDIEGLEFALKRISPAKSKIIWNLLKQHYDRISGTVESSRRKDFSHPTTSFQYSKMGSLLILHEWLPNKDGVSRKPSDIQLSELPDDFDPDSVISGRIAERLSLKRIYQQNWEFIPGYKETKEIVDILKNLPEDNRKKILESIQKMMIPNTKKDPPSPSEILGNLKDSLVRDGPSSVEPEEPRKPDITPEEEETIRQNYGEGLLKRLKQLKILHEIKIQQKNRIVDSINPKTFLLDQYDGHCQVCYTKLDLGPNRFPYFTIYRLFKFSNEVVWANTEFNVLCLCPNCHALMNHGTPLNLQNIFTTAEKIKSCEIAPEEITERNGSYYIVKILVAGRENVLYYSPTHMQKVSAFLENTKEK
jgi:hypothetical protein